MILFFLLTTLVVAQNVIPAPRTGSGGAGGKQLEVARGSFGVDASSKSGSSEKALHLARQQRLLAEIERNRKRDKVFVCLCCSSFCLGRFLIVLFCAWCHANDVNISGLDQRCGERQHERGTADCVESHEAIHC